VIGRRRLGTASIVLVRRIKVLISAPCSIPIPSHDYRVPVVLPIVDAPESKGIHPLSSGHQAIQHQKAPTTGDEEAGLNLVHAQAIIVIPTVSILIPAVHPPLAVEMVETL
jgi:hypothetical protein